MTTEDSERAVRQTRTPLLLLILAALLPALYAPGFFDFETPRFVALILGSSVLFAIAYRRGLPLARESTLLIWLALAATGVGTALTFVASRQTGVPPWPLVDFLRRTVPPLALFAAVAALVRTDGRRGVLGALALSPAIVLGLGLVHHCIAHLPGLPWQEGSGFTSTLGNTNRVGEVALLGLAPSLFLLHEAATPRRRIAAVALFAAAFALLLVSKARASFVGATVLVLVFTMLWRRLPQRKTLSLLGVVIFAGVGSSLVLPEGRSAVSALWRHTIASFDSTMPTRRVRLSLYRSSLAMLKDHPLTGVGGGCFEAACPPYREPDEWTLHGLRSLPENAHSEAATLAAELGTPGIIFGASMVAAFVCFGIRRIRGAGGPERLVSTACFAGALGLLGASSLSFTLHDPPPLFALSTLAGLLFAGAAKERYALRFVLVTFLAIAGTLSLLDAAFDFRLGQNVARYNEAGDAFARGRKGEALRLLNDLLPSLDAGLREPVKDAGRTYRTTQYLNEILKLKAYPGTKDLRGPEIEEVRAAFLKTLALSPHHLPAILDLMELELSMGRNAEAIHFRLRDALDAMRNAPALAGRLGAIARATGSDLEAFRYLRSEVDRYPRLKETEDARRRLVLVLIDLGRVRDAEAEVQTAISSLGETLEVRALGGQVALARGEDTGSMGLFPPRLEDREMRTAVAPHRMLPGNAATDDRATAQHLLSHLFEHPDDVQTLQVLTEVWNDLISKSRKSGESPDETFFEDERNRGRAIARLRVLYAADFLNSGDLESAEARLREALRYNAKQGDAYYLKVRMQMMKSDTTSAIETVKAWRRQGFSERAILEADSVTRPLIEAPEYRALGTP